MNILLKKTADRTPPHPPNSANELPQIAHEMCVRARACVRVPLTDLKASLVPIHGGHLVGCVRFLHGSLESGDDLLPGAARLAGILVLLEEEGGLAVATDDARGVARHGLPFYMVFVLILYGGSEKRFRVSASSTVI